jgi:16S rRNA (uracil1498-N3)-methyltransferase
MADRFYTEAPLAPGEFALVGPDAHHLSTVRRFSTGDQIVLFNGDGYEYPAEILATGKKQVALNLLAPVRVNRESRFPVVVGSALPKGDRADYLIEKLTEVGCAHFVPLLTARSVVQPKESKTDKLQRAVIEASKQCGRNILMRVERPHTFVEFLVRPDWPTARYLLHTAGSDRISPAQIDRSKWLDGVVFAVGPEGGLSAEELSQAIALGWQAITFGPRILRVETAAVVATAWATGAFPE